MKRYLARIMALAMTLCLFGAAAKAAVGVEDYSPMPADRCKLILPEGCVMDEVRKDGYLEISLNRSRMDWSTALATGYNFSNRRMHCQIEITPPDNEHKWSYGSSSGNMEISDLIPGAEEAEAQKPRSEPYRQYIELGRYDKENKVFEPFNSTRGGYIRGLNILFKWVDENNNNNVKREYIHVEVTSKIWPLHVEVPMVGTRRIIPGGSAGASSAVSAGQVDYTLKPFSAAYKDIETRIKAPKGASQWRNADAFGNDAPKPIQNGEIRIVNRIDREHATMDAFCIQWMDDAGKTVMYEMMDITAAEENIQLVYPGAKYAGKPVDEDRLVIENGFPPLLSTPYHPQTGELRVTPNAHVSEDFPKFAHIYFGVQPPEGATYVNYMVIDKEIAYGTHDDEMARYDESLQYWGYEVSGNKAVMVKSMPAFRRVSMVEDNGAELTWFTPVNVPSRFSGSIVILCWYGDNPTILADAGQRLEPIKREYFCITADPFLQTVKGRVYRDLSDLTFIKIPVLVIHDETEEELTLIIGTYPQSGFNATYYEISLEDSHGNVYELKNKADLYLPYPENGHMDDNRIYTLRHYVEDGDEEYIYEKLEKTPIGLRAQVSSFSPFVLSWKDGAAPKVEDLPATGDTSRTGLYLALLAGACFLLAAMRRSARKRA